MNQPENIGKPIKRSTFNPKDAPIIKPAVVIKTPFDKIPDILNHSIVEPKIRYDKPPLRTVDGKKCLTKCIPANTRFIHPSLLSALSQSYDYCSIDITYDNNDKPVDTERETARTSGKCNLEDNEKYRLPDEQLNILSRFNFDAVDLLVNIYNIHTFDDAIYWTLDNDHLPFYTIKRVHDCSWKVHGFKWSNITNVVIDYYYDIACNHWIKDYVRVIKHHYSFDIIAKHDPTNTKSGDELIKDIILYKFFSMEFFSKCLRDFVDSNSKNISYIGSPYNTIKEYIYNRLVELITKL